MKNLFNPQMKMKTYVYQYLTSSSLLFFFSKNLIYYQKCGGKEIHSFFVCFSQLFGLKLYGIIEKKRELTNIFVFRTICVVCSCIQFAHGCIDPVIEVSAWAKQKQLWMNKNQLLNNRKWAFSKSKLQTKVMHYIQKLNQGGPNVVKRTLPKRPVSKNRYLKDWFF